MVNYEHRRLLAALRAADTEPGSPSELTSWLKGTDHLNLLRTDVENVEVTLAALSPGTCLNSFVVPKDLPILGQDLFALYDWSPNPYHQDAATYSWGWGTDGVRAYQRGSASGRDLPLGVSPLVFFRSFEGVTDESRVSREIAQDFIHAAEILWRPERSAYSRLDFRGDWDDIVSLSTPQASGDTDLVTACRQAIDLHLIALGAVLVRVFEFRFRSQDLPSFSHFTDEEECFVSEDPNLQYRARVSEKGLGIIRGVQIVRPRLTPLEVEHLVKEGRIPEPKESNPVSFIVEDLRNGIVATVSTDPSTTTNYFETEGNSLPFETSPAYFRPDVLLKYKADRDKYTVLDGEIECRGGWRLRNYSVNAADQIAAYICDLRMLPHEEQQHWASHNEPPKAGLSKRAIDTDFRGKWPEDSTPSERLAHILRRWRSDDVTWWSRRDENSPEVPAVPRTESREEWGGAVVGLSNSVTEGFEVKELRQILRDDNADVDKQWGSIKLLEEILQNRGIPLPGGRLTALREVNEGRVLSGVHATGSKGADLAKSVMEQHGSFASHFEHLCEEVTKELLLIEQALGLEEGPPER